MRLAEETKKRKEREASLDKAKESIVKRHSAAMKEFQGGTMEVMDLAFKAETVGLVTREEFREKQTNLHRDMDNQHDALDSTKTHSETKQKKKSAVLSFALDEDEHEGEEEEEEDGFLGVVARLGKDPSVQTDFLPDRDKEMEEEERRRKLEEEYKKAQDAIRAEPLVVTYSYFNGSGHRRRVTIRKGDTVLQFLKCVHAQLVGDSFREIKSSSSSDLMYIKEDVILPHAMTFYELITKKAQGKSGPLFRFDVQEHVTAAADCRVPRMDSHAGKVVERHWYANNKHIHPFNKWEPFDPKKHYIH